MPGNPLPKIEINASRWPYDENGPVNGKFGEVEVTAAPKAVFDASSGQNPSGMSSGIVRVINQLSNENRVNEEIPNTGGQRGWLFNYPATGPGNNVNGVELNYELLVPQGEVWDYMRIYQPPNLEFRREWKFLVNDYSSISGWEVGDAITNGAGWWNGEITSVRDDGDGTGTIIALRITKGYASLIFPNGSTLTNADKSESVTIASSSSIGQNAKFMSLWLDNSYGEAAHGGYSNGGMFYGINAVSDEADYDGQGYNYVTASINEYKTGPNDGEHDGGKPANGAQYANALYTGEADARYNSLLFDQADNGHFVSLVFERRRNTTETSNDASFRLWKKVDRAGSEYENWTLIWETTNASVWSPHQDNKFTHGYLFGNKNGGYAEDTDFYLTHWEVWTQKPTFLTEAGV